MENKWIFAGILLVAAIVILGCSLKQDSKASSIATKEEVIPSTELVVEENNDIPLYKAPLEGSKLKKTCTKDSDCRLILVQTGAGQTRECISTDSDYKGGISEECYCKQIGTTTQSLVNGTDIISNNYECRHII